MRKIALGLMSGTSADGLTVCAVQIRPFKVLHFKNYAYPAALQHRLLTAFSLRAAELSALHFELGYLYAKTVCKFLKDFSLSAREIEVIGSHGQTVYHGPHDKTPNTLQIGEPSFLSARIGCPVVSDFRPMDIALGGEGAPLIPFFDEYFWGKKSAKILLNVGGISNFSVVGKKVNRSRKMTLVDYGFRLPSALDNRPLSFEEFENKIDQVMFGRDIHAASFAIAFALTMVFSGIVALAMRGKLRRIDMVESLKSNE